MSTDESDARKPRAVALLGTYLPRRCGIGTFTKDLHDALTLSMRPEAVTVLAMDDIAAGYAYPAEVRFQIQAHSSSQYRRASDFLNMTPLDLMIVQHEFGIYGGAAGRFVLDLMRGLRVPIITTLHTVLTEPTKPQAQVMREILELSERVVVMSRRAEAILLDVYSGPAEKIVFIPHGIPDVPFVDPSFHKDQFGVEGRKVLLTFGLLSPSKGIEVALQALPAIVDRHPDCVYVILGATHPHVLKQEGDAYRESLQRLSRRLGVADHVLFEDRFVSLDELCQFIGAADVYISPYCNVAQITSGTLAYAMGAGKAVVSTPYWYAEEMLADGRGHLFPFQDSDALAERVNALLDGTTERDAMRKRAYLYCRQMVWQEVGGRYVELGAEILSGRERVPFAHPVSASSRSLLDSPPEVDLRHLMTMTDSTGTLQHAMLTIPDRRHGYATDDNARALLAVVSYYDLQQDESVLDLATTYLAFLRDAFNRSARRFRNFMSYERCWLESVGSEDSHGRALWALGWATAYPPNNGVLEVAAQLFSAGLPILDSLASPRAWAFSLVGIHAYLQRFSGDTQVRRIRRNLAEKLYALFTEHARPDWPWCEETLTYDNAKLAHALILSGQWLPAPEMLRQGLRSLEWLLRIQTNEAGALSIIGNKGWMPRSGPRARFDQQPVEAMGLVEACIEAHRCTGEKKWEAEMQRCLERFLGHNDMHVPLYDDTTGGCRDGLMPDGTNHNEGAESTLAWLISLVAVYRFARDTRAGIGQAEQRPTEKSPGDRREKGGLEDDPATEQQVPADV